MTDGIVLLDKPAGLTSFQCLDRIKRALGTRRVGHAGTLDRFAEGLLIALTGTMTRLCPFASEMDKEYVAEVTFGRGTDTLDPEGATTAEGRVPDAGEIAEALGRFRGPILQSPPAYSAVHIDGQRAYQAARKGQTVVLAARPVTVHALELSGFTPPRAVLRIVCSKGTYVRSLARDIAEVIGTCAYVSRLRRTRSGGFLVGQAVRPDSFDSNRDLLPPRAFFDAAPGLGTLEVEEGTARKVRHGVPLDDRDFAMPPGREGPFGVFSRGGHLLAVVERRAGAFRYSAVFSEAADTDPGEPR
ncbi:MAG TPA: tRNA pseudouridine(55) synthase TruB [Spirochaetia bacterium]|nr:tRNA pseudouridine(55) synthase TruB [Spirochaetia bacterium]